MAKGAGATGAKAKVKFKGAGSFLGHRTSDYLTEPAGLDRRKILKRRPVALKSSGALQGIDDLLNLLSVILGDFHKH